MRHGTFEYEFEELQPITDLELYAYGFAIIDWEYDAADRSVGETCDYSYNVRDIVISNYKKDGAPCALPVTSELYQMIHGQLYSTRYESHILSQIKNEDD